ncbi:MAG: tRNA-guanosine(34) transglycosylase [Chlamydiae bacterium RIFCSPHIGHO2_12_FULL_49_11]|nr:MAG: tRNA-guanosine(34) transglycosylase [Chlamydiae bacterium RIFCSPHIGHO2_12_FULL_49_11]
MPLDFKVVHRSKLSRARAGEIHTDHGIIRTPSFIAVGTNGTVKALDNKTVEEIGVELMFCNTYHLMLQPGPDVVARAGGLHSFVRRRLPIITDSGGFQVFSLAYGSVEGELKGKGTKKQANQVIEISEEGVTFRSYRDGRKVVLTPEISVEAQKKFGADIIIPFDELPPYHIRDKALQESLERTHRWQLRSLETHRSAPLHQSMYGVVHGGINLALREQSLRFLLGHPFEGIAIGGSMGKTKDEMRSILRALSENLPNDKPVHLLGIGDLESLPFGVASGVDTFDSSYPTKAARHGLVLTRSGPLKIGRSIYANDLNPIDETCRCATCKHYSRAYLHHLFKAAEPVKDTLLTIHNLTYMVDFMHELRESILEDLI